LKIKSKKQSCYNNVPVTLGVGFSVVLGVGVAIKIKKIKSQHQLNKIKCNL
jgi:hypothetical protein